MTRCINCKTGWRTISSSTTMKDRIKVSTIGHRLNGTTRSDQRRPQPSGRTLFPPFRGLVIGANHKHLCPRRTRRAAENGNCRTATATSFCPRRATKNGNGNTFVRGGRGGPRRTATAELQLQLLFVHEGPRRTATATPLSAEDTEGRGERQLQNCNCNFFLSTKGHEGPRSTPLFIHEGY